MKLIKITNDTPGAYFCATEFRIGEFVRTGRYRNMADIINVISKHIDSGLFVNEIEFVPGETIIWELEFEKIEDLIELIPEEFL